MKSRVLTYFKLAVYVLTVAVGLFVTFIIGWTYVSDAWIPDLLSNFRFVYLVLLFVCLLLCSLLRRFRTALAITIPLAITAQPFLTYLLPANTHAEVSGKSISILNFNTEFKHNYDVSSFRDCLLKDKQPDIVCLVEVNRRWLDALAPIMADYPHRILSITGPGMAVFSKLPIKRHEVRFYGKSHHPRILFTANSSDGDFDVLVVHPTTPKGEEGFNERNSELGIIAEEAKGLRRARIVVGDLNCGPWSKRFQTLLLLAGLDDSAQGFGLVPTWPARWDRIHAFIPIPPLIPIDHVLLSRPFFVTDRQVGPAIGSDHLPVLVTLKFQLKSGQ